MHRFRSWTLDPPEWRTQRNRLLPAEGGDGSTLSLDFTSGVLDPRLTFTRSTNATFINSQGLVEFAAANILRNSVMAGGSTSGLSAPTSWSAGVSGESYRTQIVIDGCEQWKQVASSTRPYMTITIPNTELAVGVQYVASVYVDSFTTGTLFATLDNFFSYNEPSGTTVSSVTWVAPNGSTGASQPLAIGRIQLRFVLSAIGASGFQLRIGIGVQNTATGTVEFSRPQCERGTVAKPFFANTSTSAANYNTPRFDYDPSTLQPRGLLIEGSSVNYVLRSDVTGFPSPWSTAGTNLPTVTAGYTGGGFSPDGITYPTRLQFGVNAGGSASRLLQATTYATNPTTANPYTVSVWMKSNTAGTNYTVNIYGTTGNNLVTVTPTWQRFQVVNTSGTSLVGYIYISNESTSIAADVSIWGVQLEAGNGASSLIPTGASTGNRAFDYCEMGNIIPLNYSTTNGSMLYEGQFSQFRATSFATMRTAFCTAAGAIEAFGAFAYGSTMYPTAQDATGNTALATISPVMTLNTNLKAAWSLNASLASGEVRGCINGGSVAASGTTSMSATATPTILTIGGRPGYGLYYPCGTIKRVKYWPTTLSDATLQSITT